MSNLNIKNLLKFNTEIRYFLKCRHNPNDVKDKISQ